MIARSALPFSLRNFLDSAAFVPMLRRIGRDGALWLSDWKSRLAAFEGWASATDLAARRDALRHDRTERFRRFCQACEAETPHEGFDELGAGWYAQICRCRLCGRHGMRVWALGWW
jgi:hypothetical protein